MKKFMLKIKRKGISEKIIYGIGFILFAGLLTLGKNMPILFIVAFSVLIFGTSLLLLLSRVIRQTKTTLVSDILTACRDRRFVLDLVMWGVIVTLFIFGAVFNYRKPGNGVN
jgi:hypothetical protein